jgi:excisionase family DNA binding protein
VGTTKAGPKLLTITEAARGLGIHVSTLRRWADSGQIAVVRLPSGYRRFEPAVVEQKRKELGFQG